MKKYLFTLLIVIIASIVLLISCTEKAIPYDLSDSDLNIDTLTVKLIDGGTYLAPPLMGSTEGLYFGEADGFKNLFSLIQFSSISLSGAVWTTNLLDSTVTVDSMVIEFTMADSVIIPTTSGFELYYFPEGGDSVFSETESNYLNINESNVSGAVRIGPKSTFTQGIPDSINPKLSFKFTDAEDLINFIADTSDATNRTFMLRNVDQIDDIISINSRESIDYPIMNVYYRVGIDTLHSVYYPLKDITVVEPRSITNIDKDNISVGRAAGLKSIIKFDFKDFPIDSTVMVIKSAELIFHSMLGISLGDYEIKAAILDSSFSISKYWEINKDEYTIESNVLMTGTFKDNQMKMEIRSFLQGVNTNSYNNFGLKLYGSSSSDPFKTANLILDQNNSDNNPYLRIIYVKL